MTWEQAVAARDQPTIDAWYTANTGHRALGLRDSDLWDVGGRLDLTDAWLAAHDGNGHVTRNPVGWTVRAVKCTGIRYMADYVTVSGALLHRDGPDAYGAAYFGTSYTDAAHHGAVLEYATLDGNGSSTFATYFLTSDPWGADTTIVRNCDIFGWRSGGTLRDGNTMTYCRVHDLAYTAGSHNTSASVRGSDTKVVRNNFKDGNSAALSLYADFQPLVNVTVQENILNTPNAYYGLQYPPEAHSPESRNARLLGNLFGQEFFPKCGSAGPMTGAERFTEKLGNSFMDGTPVT